MNAKRILQLTAAREALAKAITKLTVGDEQLTKLERDRASVVSQIEQLETAVERSPEDSDGIAHLAVLREQRILFDRKLAKLQVGQRYDESPQRALDEAAEVAGGLLIQSAQPELDRLLSEARAAFTPFYRDPTRLKLAVERNDKILSLKAHLTNGGSGPVNEKPKRLLAILDRLRTGADCGWTWQPAPAPPPAT